MRRTEKHDRVNAEVEVPPTLTAVALHDEEWFVDIIVKMFSAKLFGSETHPISLLAVPPTICDVIFSLYALQFLQFSTLHYSLVHSFTTLIHSTFILVKILFNFCSVLLC